jgi:7,8-dihydro-6-hydroxymethylpterin dimethyltransferase
VFLEYAKSICPVCKAVVDGEVNVRDGRVYLRKRCADHGSFEALVDSDAEMYLDSQRFNKPGTLPLATQTEVRDGCPLDCGLCPDHRRCTTAGRRRTVPRTRSGTPARKRDRRRGGR